jgi:hypothetical protein
VTGQCRHRRHYRNFAWWIIDEVGGRDRCDGAVGVVNVLYAVR